MTTDLELAERLCWLDDNAPNYGPQVMSSWIDSVRPELAKAAAALREAHERLEGAYGSIREHMESLREAHAEIERLREGIRILGDKP